jgi:EAL and modified HD-GYP domain-containing signal transduction protein
LDRVLLSRQPIYKADMEIFGYELLFRDRPANRAEIRDEHEATAQVIVNTFMEIGPHEMVQDRRACINVSPKFLLSDFCEALPADRVVLELVGQADFDSNVLQRLKHLVSRGFDIAVGDFVFSERFRPLLDIAAIVKFDVLASDLRHIERLIAQIDRKRIKLAAERVETGDQFRFCKDACVDYFQGYYFCKPEIVRATRLPLSRLMTLRLIGRLHDPNVTFDELEQALRQDLSLSYKLLRYVGSAARAVRGQINSIRHAAALAGMDRLRIWAGLILFSGIEEKLGEFTITAVTRARMCEKLAEAMNLQQSADRCFLVGLFSVLDSMLGRPMPDIVESLHLAPEINSALISRQGDLGAILECVIAYERRDWDNARCGNLDPEAVRSAYVKAMAWSIRTLNGFSDVVSEETAKTANLTHWVR